ncbi:MAG: nuclear transport factor 2 family protein [Rikenellaceae bacterium]
MKKLILSAVALVAIATASAHELEGTVDLFEFDKFNVHIYTSPEAMGDVTIMVEGEKGVTLLEPQSFYKSIEELNTYIKYVGKPLDRVVANYHAGGLASYDSRRIVMVEPMVEFMGGEMAQGMMNKFSNVFQGAMDTRLVKVRKTISAASKQRFSGVEFGFSPGAHSDFPASSVNIGGEVFYTHFAPSKSHLSPMQLNSAAAVDAILGELVKGKESGCSLFVGSHGAVASLEEVDFMIEYLGRVKELIAECENSDIFSQKLLMSYPSLPGAENIQAVAKKLYSDEPQCVEREAVRGRVHDYFDMVSNLDMDIAKGLWAERDDVSIITPRGHFVGADSIMNDFLLKAFSKMQYRKLSSISEVINIYGDSANVQLYWIFDTIDANGEKHQTKGRESLIFSKIDNEWRLVHVHYSRMPQ